MAEELIDMSEADWLAEGRRRFGWDMMQWKFVCPICKHVQTVIDFKPYADRGARPDSARNECIGRYAGCEASAFSRTHDLPPGGPCDYAAYGLIQVAPVRVTMAATGKVQHCFAFADPEPVGA